MQQTCANPFCRQPFQITPEDLAFYEKVSPVFNGNKELIPPPTRCPDCRLQRKLAGRNERNLHKRTCDLCKKNIIASFPTGSPFPVYCKECWWSDRWNPFDYGQEYDFSRPFFAQFSELLGKVPKAAVLQLNNENCDYCHMLAFSKNAYLCPGSFSVQDCLYLRKSQYCRDCVSSNILNKCELVSDSTNCDNCTSSHHLINCRSCSFSMYLSDATRVNNCFMCSGIADRQYCFRNAQLSKEEYEATLGRYARTPPEALLAEFQEFSRTIPKRAQIQLNCEDSTGDYLTNCRRAHHCSDCTNCEDVKYLLECEGVRDSMDLCLHDKDISLCYEMNSGGERNYLTTFSYCTIASPRSSYLSSCFYQPDSFGCESLHERSENNILNKHYTKQEYENLMPKIIEHMRSSNEWGEYFPVQTSIYAYNESAAQDYYPLTKEEVQSRGWQWRDEQDEMPTVDRIIPAQQLPDSIDDVPDDILNWAIVCEATKRPFRIIRQELAFYRKMGLRIPHLHPDERHKRLMALRNPRKLWDRNCATCGTKIMTSFAPERPERVLCEECYLKEVY